MSLHIPSSIPWYPKTLAKSKGSRSHFVIPSSLGSVATPLQHGLALDLSELFHEDLERPDSPGTAQFFGSKKTLGYGRVPPRTTRQARLESHKYEGFRTPWEKGSKAGSRGSGSEWLRSGDANLPSPKSRSELISVRLTTNVRTLRPGDVSTIPYFSDVGESSHPQVINP